MKNPSLMIIESIVNDRRGRKTDFGRRGNVTNGGVLAHSGGGLDSGRKVTRKTT